MVSAALCSSLFTTCICFREVLHAVTIIYCFTILHLLYRVAVDPQKEANCCGSSSAELSMVWKWKWTCSFSLLHSIHTGAPPLASPLSYLFDLASCSSPQSVSRCLPPPLIQGSRNLLYVDRNWGDWKHSCWTSGCKSSGLKQKDEGNSSWFVSLHQSLIPYYPAAALERERGEQTLMAKRKFKVWVDWFPGDKWILVAVSPGKVSYPLCPMLLIFCVRERTYRK